MQVERAPVDIEFTCRRCGWDWREHLERVRATDYDGDTVESYCRGSVPVPSPALGRRCPRCGGLDVNWLDTTHLPRRITKEPPRPLVTSRWATAERRATVPKFFTRFWPQREPRTRRFP